MKKREWSCTVIGLESKVVDEKGGIIAHVGERNTLEEIEANGNLLAAAPDMDEALKDIREFVLSSFALGPNDGQIIATKCSVGLARVEGK